MRTKYKIVFLGDPSVGKTTLISQFTNKEADENYHPTIGIDFTYLRVNLQGKDVRLQLWDTAGQERYNSIIPNYTRKSFAAVIVFDLKHLSSFDNIDHWIKDLVLINDPDRLIKIVIVGNKKDLMDEREREEIKIKAVEKAKEYDGKYIETCAMKYADIRELVDHVNDLVIQDCSGNNEEENEDVVEIQAQKGRGCCPM
ncbi:small GTP-binding protein domain [Vavraia culicis subsp. floridensis]|uniref:Small GTP-binding protein domain n=1 Tax=Vavraia culicis (isolate floridensis) TaxID=948595 RepID=L2GX42_VAVCU|nr:small GTP-binding protein domain [Vavraia culicis subsp. floridensis]ELA48209.1 small GTP-binding protein domain [Vavraia culicis subsp. floridensis]